MEDIDGVGTLPKHIKDLESDEITSIVNFLLENKEALLNQAPFYMCMLARKPFIARSKFRRGKLYL